MKPPPGPHPRLLCTWKGSGRSAGQVVGLYRRGATRGRRKRVRSQRRRSACGMVVGGVGRPVPTAAEAARSEGIWAGADADAATTVVSACWSAHRDPPSRPKAAYRSVSRPRREHPHAATKGLKHPNRGRRWPPYILGREDQPKTGSSGGSYGHRAAVPHHRADNFSKALGGTLTSLAQRKPKSSALLGHLNY